MDDSEAWIASQNWSQLETKRLTGITEAVEKITSWMWYVVASVEQREILRGHSEP